MLYCVEKCLHFLDQGRLLSADDDDVCVCVWADAEGGQ